MVVVVVVCLTDLTSQFGYSVVWLCHTVPRCIQGTWVFLHVR